MFVLKIVKIKIIDQIFQYIYNVRCITIQSSFKFFDIHNFLFIEHSFSYLLKSSLIREILLRYISKIEYSTTPHIYNMNLRIVLFKIFRKKNRGIIPSASYYLNVMISSLTSQNGVNTPLKPTFEELDVIKSILPRYELSI